MKQSILILSGVVAVAGCSGTVIPDFRDFDPVEPAVAAPPPPPPPPPEVRLLSAIEAQGCVLTADNTEAVLLAANMTLAEMRTTMERLDELGRVEPAGGPALRVITDRCA